MTPGEAERSEPTMRPESPRRGRAWRIGIVAFVLLVLGAAVAFGLVAWEHWYRYGWPVPGTERPQAFAIRGDTMALLRVVDEGSVEVALRDMKTGATQVVYSGAGEGRAIALEDEWVVWSLCDASGVMPCTGRTFAMKREGGVQSEVFSEALRPIVATRDEVYGLTNRGALHGGPSGAPLEFVSVPGGEVLAIASTDDVLYAMTAVNIEAREKGKGFRSIGPGCASGGDLAAAEGGVYVACENYGSAASIDFLSLDGSPPSHVGEAIKVEGLLASPRGLVVLFETPIPDEPGSSSSTLGIFPTPGAPMTVLLERSGWGPLGLYDGKLYLLEYRAIAARRLP